MLLICGIVSFFTLNPRAAGWKRQLTVIAAAQTLGWPGVGTKPWPAHWVLPVAMLAL